MSSNNQPTIASLVNGISGGLSPGQSYDLLKRISEDLDIVFSHVDDGLDVSAEHIDLTETPESQFPATVAFTDKINTFSVDQNITGILRIKNQILSSTSASGFFCDDRTAAGNFGGMYKSGGILRLWDGVTQDRISIRYTGGIGMDGCVSLPISGISFNNSVGIYGLNAAGTALLQIVQVDANNLVLLGAAADSTGNGHVSIPRDTAANLPAAGATRNGIIVMDKTNNYFCYYVNGARYFLLGTAF